MPKSNTKTVLIVLSIAVPLTILITLLLVRRGDSSRQSSMSAAADNSPSVMPTPSVLPSPSPTPTELTRELATSLLRGRMTKRIMAGMNEAGAQSPATYNQMVQANILSCDRNAWVSWPISCRPGPNAKQLNFETHYMWTPIGQMVPQVTGISKIDSTSAIADVTSTFKSGANYEFYARWQAAFSVFGAVNEQPVYSFSDVTKDQHHSVNFRLFDNGWRVQKIE